MAVIGTGGTRIRWNGMTTI